MPIKIITADYNDSSHARDLVSMLNIYALDLMGGGKALPENVAQNLVPALRQRSSAFSFLAYKGEQPVGLANCFEGFSTFKARPLVNIHDIVVHPDHRGIGISQKLLDSIEGEAKVRGACKITLEVLSGNNIAKKSYQKFGFNGYELDPEAGQALFWEKPL